MREKIARVIHHVDRGLAILNPDVYVQPENQIGARHQLQVFDNILVALVGMNLLGAPVRKRMRRHCGQPQVILPGEPHHVAPQLLDLGLGFFDVLAHRGPNLDYGLVHFRFHPLLQNHPALFQDFGVDVRPKIAGDRIDCLILLFNPDGESRRRRLLGLLRAVAAQKS